MQLKYLFLFILASFILFSGCIEKSEQKIKYTSETLYSIDSRLNECGKSLTTEQCNYWVENNLNDRHIILYGTVSDVRDGIIFIRSEETFMKFSNVNIYLYDIVIEELIKINKDKKIKFSGKINIRKTHENYYESYKNMLKNGIELRDGKIIVE